MSWLSSILQSWPVICFSVITLETQLISCFCVLRILRKPSPSTSLVIWTMHFISPPCWENLSFTRSFHSFCQQQFIISGLIAWETHSLKSYFIEIKFCYSFLSTELNSSKLNDSMMRLNSVLHCILWGKLPIYIKG